MTIAVKHKLYKTYIFITNTNKGFLRPSLNQDAVANFGLLDQIAALHWIKENIEYFGGDKSHVTLMGHGTGSACVNYLMISPVASGDYADQL